MRPRRSDIPDGHILRGSSTTSSPRQNVRARSSDSGAGADGSDSGSSPVQYEQRPHAAGSVPSVTSSRAWRRNPIKQPSTAA